MTSRNEQYMLQHQISARQWAERRQAELSRLASLQAAADAAGVALQPSAPKGRRCDLCDSRVIDGVCSFCEAVYVDGIRVPGKKAPLPFSEPLEEEG